MLPGLPTGSGPLFSTRNSGVAWHGRVPVTALDTFGLRYSVENVSARANLGVDALSETDNFTRRQVAWSWVRREPSRAGHPSQNVQAMAPMAGGGVGGEQNLYRTGMEYTRFQPDPLSRGRNTFAFRLRGDAVRPFGGQALPVFEGLFLGGETVRGFRFGELSPAAVLSSEGTSKGISAVWFEVPTPHWGFNAEYRMPVSDQLQAAAFFDLGVVGLLGQDRVLSDVPDGYTRLSESRRALGASTDWSCGFLCLS